MDLGPKSHFLNLENSCSIDSFLELFFFCIFPHLDEKALGEFMSLAYRVCKDRQARLPLKEIRDGFWKWLEVNCPTNFLPHGTIDGSFERIFDNVVSNDYEKHLFTLLQVGHTQCESCTVNYQLQGECCPLFVTESTIRKSGYCLRKSVLSFASAMDYKVNKKCPICRSPCKTFIRIESDWPQFLCVRLFMMPNVSIPERMDIHGGSYHLRGAITSKSLHFTACVFHEGLYHHIDDCTLKVPSAPTFASLFQSKPPPYKTCDKNGFFFFVYFKEKSTVDVISNPSTTAPLAGMSCAREILGTADGSGTLVEGTLTTTATVPGIASTILSEDHTARSLPPGPTVQIPLHPGVSGNSAQASSDLAGMPTTTTAMVPGIASTIPSEDHTARSLPPGPTVQIPLQPDVSGNSAQASSDLAGMPTTTTTTVPGIASTIPSEDHTARSLSPGPTVQIPLRPGVSGNYAQASSDLSGMPPTSTATVPGIASTIPSEDHTARSLPPGPTVQIPLHPGVSGNYAQASSDLSGMPPTSTATVPGIASTIPSEDHTTRSLPPGPTVQIPLHPGVSGNYAQASSDLSGMPPTSTATVPGIASTIPSEDHTARSLPPGPTVQIPLHPGVSGNYAQASSDLSGMPPTSTATVPGIASTIPSEDHTARSLPPGPAVQIPLHPGVPTNSAYSSNDLAGTLTMLTTTAAVPGIASNILSGNPIARSSCPEPAAQIPLHPSVPTNHTRVFNDLASSRLNTHRLSPAFPLAGPGVKKHASSSDLPLGGTGVKKESSSTVPAAYVFPVSTSATRTIPASSSSKDPTHNPDEVFVFERQFGLFSGLSIYDINESAFVLLTKVKKLIGKRDSFDIKRAITCYSLDPDSELVKVGKEWYISLSTVILLSAVNMPKAVPVDQLYQACTGITDILLCTWSNRQPLIIGSMPVTNGVLEFDNFRHLFKQNQLYRLKTGLKNILLDRGFDIDMLQWTNSFISIPIEAACMSLLSTKPNRLTELSISTVRWLLNGIPPPLALQKCLPQAVPRSALKDIHNASPEKHAPSIKKLTKELKPDPQRTNRTLLKRAKSQNNALVNVTKVF